MTNSPACASSCRYWFTMLSTWGPPAGVTLEASSPGGVQSPRTSKVLMITLARIARLMTSVISGWSAKGTRKPGEASTVLRALRISHNLVRGGILIAAARLIIDERHLNRHRVVHVHDAVRHVVTDVRTVHAMAEPAGDWGRPQPRQRVLQFRLVVGEFQHDLAGGS